MRLTRAIAGKSLNVPGAATTVSERELAFRQRLDESARRLAYGHLEGSCTSFEEGSGMDGMDRGAARWLRACRGRGRGRGHACRRARRDGGGADAAGLRERPGAGRPGLQRLGRVDPAPALGRDGVRHRRRRQARPHARRRHAAGPDRHRGSEGAGDLRVEPVLRGHVGTARQYLWNVEPRARRGAAAAHLAAGDPLQPEPDLDLDQRSEHVGAARLRRRALGVAGHRASRRAARRSAARTRTTAPRRSSTGSTGGRRATRRSTATPRSRPPGRRARSA